jgi:hypothetical protein
MLSDRVSDCALATLTDRAIDARRTQLAPWVAPDDFAARLRIVLASLTIGTSPPLTETDRWRAGSFRWQHAWEALRAAAGQAGPTPNGPHPDTAQWRVHGLDLDAPTAPEQFEQLQTHPAYAEGNEHVLLGDTNTSGLHQAVLNVAGSITPDAITRAFQHATHLTPDDLLLVPLQDHFAARPQHPEPPRE